jgi:hypothetical protein
MQNFERIKSSLEKSSLSSTDQLAIRNIYAEVPDEHLASLADLFEEKPEWIEIFNDNRIKKITAQQSGDAAAWQKIFDEEKKMFEKIVYDSD